MAAGIHSDFTLAHPSVSSGAAVGFFLVPERGRTQFQTRRARAGKPARLATGGTAFVDFGPGSREWRLSVRFEPHSVDYRQAAAGGGTLAQLREFYALVNTTLTLGTPTGETYSVRFLALEERAHLSDAGSSAEIALVEAL